MAQRQAASTNDHLTIAGLLVLGLTSALVGALVVAPTLAPKRMALVSDLESATRIEPTKKLPLPQSASGAVLGAEPSANAPGPDPVGGASGNAPGGNSTEDVEEPVSIRKPGELVGPPAPPGLTRPSVEAVSESASDRRESKTALPEVRTANTNDMTASTRRGSERRETENESSSSDRRKPETSTSAPDETESRGTEDSQTDDGDEEKRTRVYRVQSGKFNTRGEAEKAQLELAKTGKGGFIVPAGDGFRLQLGVFRSKENAEKAAETARQQSIMVDVRPER